MSRGRRLPSSPVEAEPMASEPERRGAEARPARRRVTRRAPKAIQVFPVRTKARNEGRSPPGEALRRERRPRCRGNYSEEALRERPVARRGQAGARTREVPRPERLEPPPGCFTEPSLWSGSGSPAKKGKYDAVGRDRNHPFAQEDWLAPRVAFFLPAGTGMVVAAWKAFFCYKGVMVINGVLSDVTRIHTNRL